MTVVIYGASSVIGQAVVEAFLADGKKVVAADHIAFPEALKAHPALAGGDGRLTLLAREERQGEDVDFSEFFARCEAAVGPVRTFVCVAPPVVQKPVLDLTAAEIRGVVEDELVVPALLMQEAARRMTANGGGRIIVFCSMSAKTGVHTLVAPYAAAKGGLLAYMRTMAAELAMHGVNVNGIATSLFEPQVANMPETERAELTLGIPARRFGKPSEAAGAAVYLASESAAFITGETLNLSGGRFMD